MQALIINSFNILMENDSNVQTVYDWMDLGDVICEKLRYKAPLTEEEILLIDKLNIICKRIKLDNNIILYRGTKEEFDPIIAGKQFNAMSPNIKIAETYGPYITKIIVPLDSNAFYISAWELINAQVEAQDEKEVLLLPGRFILHMKLNGITTYIYELE